MLIQGGKFKKKISFFIILLLSVAGFFCLPMLPMLHPNIIKAASQGDIVINELAWMGTQNSANDEWIELFNKSATAIDLTGWTLTAVDGQPNISLSGSLTAGGYFLLERTSDDTVSSVTADQIYTGALGNSGEILELRDGNGNLIDKVDASAGWPVGDNITKATMERKDDSSWQTSAVAGGSPKAQNTLPQLPADQGQVIAQCGNGILETGEQCDDNNTVNGDGCSSSCQTESSGQEEQTVPPTSVLSTETIKYRLGDVVINEFVVDPTDGEEEWVEIFNTTSKEIDLTGWKIEEGSQAKTNLSGIISASGSGKFKVVDKISGNLNNAGDIIILRDNQGNLIDQVAYGIWDDGDKANNAPTAADPGSVARKFDGLNSYNNFSDFAATAKPTKGAGNIIIEDGENASARSSEQAEGDRANYDYSNEILITEIFPNPIGDDSANEFIELLNGSDRDVNLAGWKLSDATDKKVLISTSATSTILKAKEYLVLYRNKTKIALNNDADSVKLYRPLEEKAFQTVKYEDVVEGWSYNSDSTLAGSGQDQWQWSEEVTPGAVNVIKTINHAPEVDFVFKQPVIVNAPVIFDASDTTDQDGDDLKFSWDFGDGLKNNLINPEHTFLKVGAYNVVLIVSDGELEAKKEKIVKVVNSVEDVNASTTGSLVPFSGTQDDIASNVILNEFLPNPEGSDTDLEWIELKNAGNLSINLMNWSIKDESEASYKFNRNYWLEAGKFYLLDRAESKLSLNNDSEIVILYNDLDQLADQVEYADAAEGQAYARGQNSKWFWTTVLTPGEENILSVSASKNSQIAGVKISQTSSGDTIIETTLEKVKELEVGDKVKIRGTVAVLPGVLGTQIFYITGSGGLQIYNYKKDFPNLKIGDEVEITGELSLAYDELRLKTSIKDDIKIIEHKEAPVAVISSCEKLDEDSVGQLITLAGQITDRKSSTVYIDDGTDEAMIYVKAATGIDAKIFTEGVNATVTGIVGKTKTGVRLMPRSQADIVLAVATSDNPRVLGEVSESDQWQVEARDKKLELFKYLLIISGAVIIVLIALMIKFRKAKNI